MTDEEFYTYCAETMGYIVVANNQPAASMPSAIHLWHAKSMYEDLSEQAKVFDKLWKTHSRWMQAEDFGLIQIDKGIAQAMREFIESTKGESE